MMDKLISQQAAIDKIKKRLFETAFNNVGIKQNIDETLVDVAENRLENWFDELPSVQPEIIYCKDCKFYTAYDYTGKLMCKRIGKGMILPKPEDYCSYAERITDGRPD